MLHEAIETSSLYKVGVGTDKYYLNTDTLLWKGM